MPTMAASTGLKVSSSAFAAFAAGRRAKLSDYFPPLKGTAGDTDVFVFEGAEPGDLLVVDILDIGALPDLLR